MDDELFGPLPLANKDLTGDVYEEMFNQRSGPDDDASTFMSMLIAEVVLLRLAVEKLTTTTNQGKTDD